MLAMTGILSLSSIALYGQGASGTPNYNILTRNGIARMEALPAPSPLAAQQGEIVDGKYFRLVQFWQIPDASQKRFLEMLGVEFLDYIPHKAYVVAIPETFPIHQWAAFGVRAIGRLESSLKVNPLVQNGMVPDFAVRQPGTLDVVVQYFPTIRPETALGVFSAVGAEIQAHNPNAHWVKLRIADHAVSALAQLPHVKYVEADQEPGTPESDDGRGQHRANVLDADYGAGLQFDGTGVSAVINDDGFVGPHIDFKGRNEQSDVAGDFTGNHGDMTTGILGGAGNLDPVVRGMAPGAFIHVLQYNSNMAATVFQHTTNNVMVFSTSYSNGCNAGYTIVTAQIDQEVNNNPSIHQVFSAGNNGTSNCGYGAGSGWGNITGGHKIAKNVMACANLNSDESLVGSSSRGPASDGRLKPDISSHGNGQISTDENYTYQIGGGTSAAAPGVAGVSVQLYHAYRALNGGANPENALIKAVLMNTADEIGNPGPDFSYGWGRINGRKAYLALSQNQYLAGSVSNGGTQSHTLAIPANVKQAKVMVYWRDPAGSTIAAKALVNDLDMVVTDPSSGAHLPLVLNPTPNVTLLNSPAQPGVDTLNNVEQVTLSNPAAGNYTVTISGTEVPTGPQGYFITWSFEMDEIVVTYPNGGEGFQPGITERLRWDAFGTTGTYTIEYSTDNGTNWTVISSAVPGTVTYRDWNPVSAVSGQCLIRVSRGGISGTSPAPFTIMPRPTNLRFDYVCPDSTKFAWNAVTGATGYEVSLLGAMYMDSVATVTGTSHVFVGMNPFVENWVSVRAIGPNGAKSRRALAVQVPQAITNCVLAHDVEAKLLSPAAGQLWTCLGASNTPIKIRLTNEGANTLTNIPVKYQLNGGTVVTETYPGPLAPGASFDYSFAATINTSNPGAIDLSVWADYPTDGNRFNDSITQETMMMAGGMSVSFPWSDNFETFSQCNTATNCEGTTCNLNNGWLNYSNGAYDDIDFRADIDGTPSNLTGPTIDHNPGNTNGKYVYLESSGPCPEKLATLLSPCIDLAGGINPSVTFWYHMYGSDMGSLQVDVIADMERFDNVFTTISGNQGDIWRSATVDLNAFTGKKVALRFHGITGLDYESDLALDDINLNLTPVSVLESLSNGIGAKVYPNPSNGLFELELNNLPAQAVKVSVYDLMGKQLFARDLNVQSTVYKTGLDLQHIAKGVYFLKVMAGEQVSTLRITIQ